MLTVLPERVCLFLLVRTHAQLRHYLKLDDSRSAANGLSTVRSSSFGNVTEIHPLIIPTLRRRG